MKCLFILLFCTLPVFGDAAFRTWESNTGHKVEAKFLTLNEDSVELLLATESLKTVPLNVLSEKDIEYVKSYTGKNFEVELTTDQLPSLKIKGRSTTAISKKKDYILRGLDVTYSANIAVYNDGQDDIEVEVFWMLISGSHKKSIGFNNYYPVSLASHTMTVRGRASERIETGKFEHMPLFDYRTKHWKLEGFVAQVYYEGKMIDSFASKHTLENYKLDTEKYKFYHKEIAKKNE